MHGLPAFCMDPVDPESGAQRRGEHISRRRERPEMPFCSLFEPLSQEVLSEAFGK